MKGVLTVALVFGVLAVLLAFSRWLARRPWAAAGNLVVALVLFYLARTFWPAAENLATYHSSPVEGPIAQVTCERTAPHAYRVTLTRLPDGRMQLFEINGDEWRLDIRTLAWRDRAAGLGLNSGFRLDRLSARFLASNSASPEGGSAGPVPSSYSLSESDEAGEDIWAQARIGTRWERYADARHAYVPWQPLAHEGRFDVWLRQRGPGVNFELEARPVNEAAAKAVQARQRATAAAKS